MLKQSAKQSAGFLNMRWKGSFWRTIVCRPTVSLAFVPACLKISAGEWKSIEYKGLQVVESTGPFMTTRVYDSYPKKDEITLLPAELVTPLSADEVQRLIDGDVSPEMEEKVEKAFAIHYFWGSWYPQISM